MPISSAAQARARASAQARNPSGSRVERSPGPISLRLQTNLVVLPVLVYKKNGITGPTTFAEKRCNEAITRTFYKLPLSKPYLPRNCDDSLILGLTAKDFRIFQDGVEQKIQGLTLGRWRITVRDNWGMHDEFNEMPRGIWSTAEENQSVFSPSDASYFYNIAYVPSEPRGSKGCHKIRVKVNLRDASVVLPRSRFCSGQTPSDPLNGTWLGGRMLRDLTTGKRGDIRISLQVGWVRGHGAEGRVYVALQFPGDSLGVYLSKYDGLLHGTIGVLGLVRRDGAAPVTRFTSLGCCSHFFPKYYDVADYVGGSLTSLIRTRYETQIDLRPGKYDLQLILSNGRRFGRADATLDIPKYAGKRLAMSSVLLCKRYRNAHAAAVEDATANLAPRYVPLVSMGVRFTPAGDTNFKKGEPLIAYFQVYEPLLATHPDTKVEAHVKILDAKTGKAIKTFHVVNAATYEQAGSTTISIARKIPFAQLPKGAYRLEVQATDSAGESTPWRTADFTVQETRGK